MKRLIPATVILFSTILICVYAHTFIKKSCNDTLVDINRYNNREISASELENSWKKRKEKMSLFVNHGFLDNISLYIGQLTLTDNTNTAEIAIAHKNIESTLTLIITEQKLGLHSFY